MANANGATLLDRLKQEISCYEEFPWITTPHLDEILKKMRELATLLEMPIGQTVKR